VGVDPYRKAGHPAGWPGRADGSGAGQTAGRPAGRDRRDRDTAADRRADLPGAGRAQGRRNEVRAGSVDLRSGPAAGDRRAVPGDPDQASGIGPAAAQRHCPRSACQGLRAQLARPVRRVQRQAGRCRFYRPGAPRPLAGRAGCGREDPVPRCGPGSAQRLHAAQPGRPAVLRADARAGGQAGAGRVAGQGGRGT